MRARRLGNTMLRTAIARRGRDAAKRATAWLMDRARGVDGLPLAAGKVLASDILAGTYPSIDLADFRHSFLAKEDIPDDGIDVPHRPVNTFHLLLDSRDPRYSCRNHVVIGPGRMVLYEDGIPFEEMSVRLRLLEWPRRVSGTVAYLSNTDSDNYYHWLALVLPLIGIYRERLGFEADFYYVGRPIKPFHLETLARAGVGAERVVSDAVVADRLVADFADRKRREGAVDRAMLGFTRGLYFERPAAPPMRRIFVGRRDAAHRHLANEAECAEYAARHGFEDVSMEGRTVAEQGRLFAEAAFIVGAHGAALTNLLFATPGCHVLELMPARPSPSAAISAPLLTAFREISAFVGCRHECIFGEALPGQRHLAQSHADFAISFDEFRDKLEAMMAPDAASRQAQIIASRYKDYA